MGKRSVAADAFVSAMLTLAFGYGAYYFYTNDPKMMFPFYDKIAVWLLLGIASFVCLLIFLVYVSSNKGTRRNTSFYSSSAPTDRYER